MGCVNETIFYKCVPFLQTQHPSDLANQKGICLGFHCPTPNVNNAVLMENPAFINTYPRGHEMPKADRSIISSQLVFSECASSAHIRLGSTRKRITLRGIPTPFIIGDALS